VNASTSSIENLARPLLDLAFRFRVPLSWIIAICGFIFARPTVVSIIAGSALAAIGMGWRAWAAGTIRKNTEIAQDGPYALSRHPLYFGNLTIAAGFGLASGRLLIFCAIMALCFAVYLPLMRDEEAIMVSLFGDRYREYMSKMPRLIPAVRRSDRAHPQRRFSWSQYLANHEYNAALGYCAAVALLIALHLLHQH
jgi:protein-S-isoprenylcysteine O-methyltransferase Ste14